MFAGAVIFGCHSVLAQSVDEGFDYDDRGFDYGEIGPVFDVPGSRDGYIDFGPLGPAADRYFGWKEAVGKDTGLNYVLEDRLINQRADGAQIYDNELNAIARWDLVDGLHFGAGSLNAWVQFANTLGQSTASEFQSALGVLSPLNGGNGGPDTSAVILQMLAWEQIAPGGRFRMQFGKLSTRTLVNLNRYAHGDSETFFSPMLGNNPVVPYTALLGSGIFAQWKEDGWYVSGLVRGADVEKGLSLDAIENGDLEYIAEAALTPETALGYGEYRFTVSHDTGTETRPQVTSFSASFDQDLGERLGGFLRYAYAPDTFRSFEERLALGLIVKQPFDFREDQFGVGGWWGQPSDAALNDETGIEAFYRAQISRSLQITPDLQVIFDPAQSENDAVAVLGLRLRLEL